MKKIQTITHALTRKVLSLEEEIAEIKKREKKYEKEAESRKDITVKTCFNKDKYLKLKKKNTNSISDITNKNKEAEKIPRSK